jgi:hypothetical protein
MHMKNLFGRLAVLGTIGVVTAAFSLVPLPSMGGQTASATSLDKSSLGKLCHELVAAIGPGTATAATCPTTPGTVTGETGAVGGVTYDYVDAMLNDDGATWQHQYTTVLTTKPMACQHYQNNQIVMNEMYLIPNTIVWNPDNTTAAPGEPGTYQIGVEKIGSDGKTHFYAQAQTQPHSKTCGLGKSLTATSGTITYTTMSSTLAEGSYDLYFGTEHVTGTFSAPKCLLCSARPSRTTCLTAA